MVSLFNYFFIDSINNNVGDSNMGKLSHNGIFKRCRNLSLFALIILLSLTPILAKNYKDKLEDFEKLTDKEKINILFEEVVNSRPDLKLYGTEYAVGQKGTVWLQLRDDEGQPVNDGNCHINIWKPNQLNQTHPIWITNSPMLYLPTSDGLYYYDFIVPQEEGVYLMSASCTFVVYGIWYYEGAEEQMVRTPIWGTFIGDSIVLNDFNDYLYTKCSSANEEGGKRCKSQYDWVLDNTTFQSLDLFWAGETDSSSTVEFFVYNWTNSEYIRLPNIKLISGTGSNNPIGIDEFVFNTIPSLNDTISDSNQVRIVMNVSSGNTFSLFNNWLSLRANQEGEYLFDMRGSGEIHVSSGNVTGVSFVASVENVSNVANALSTFERLKYSGATEYISNTTGQLLYQYIRVQSGNPLPINNANCTAWIWNPDGIIWLNETQMTYMDGSDGLYNKTFTVPSQQGIYKVQVRCSDPPKVEYGSSTFHVEDTIFNNQQTIYNFQQAMNTTLVNGQEYIKTFLYNMNATMVANQEYIKSNLNVVFDYVNDMIDTLYGMVIS